MESPTAVVVALKAERERLARSGTAARVTEILREQIAGGLFPPGTRLSEEAIGEALGVSRNTLREAFRLLGHEQLVVHELNRGVFVRVLRTDLAAVGGAGLARLRVAPLAFAALARLGLRVVAAHRQQEHAAPLATGRLEIG